MATRPLGIKWDIRKIIFLCYRLYMEEILVSSLFTFHTTESL